MRPFTEAFQRLTADWDHRITVAIGGAATVTTALDYLTKFLGLIAVLVAIYCSVSRELRERRRDRRVIPNQP